MKRETEATVERMERDNDRADEAYERSKGEDMDDIPIPEIDRERLEGMVAAYRRSIENLYRLAHTQGAIEADNEIRAKLKALNTKVLA